MRNIQTHCIACGHDLTEMRVSTKGVLCWDCADRKVFRKKLIITGITRMNHGNICISGIDPETWRFIRPVCTSGLTRAFVMEGQTQVISHFNIVEMEFSGYRPSEEYHTEDWMLNENYPPRFIRHLTDGEKLAVLKRVSVENLKEELEKKNQSLFVVKVKHLYDLWHEKYERFSVRVNFVDEAGNLYLRFPVTDLLLLAYARSMVMQKKEYSLDLMRHFNSHKHKYIRIGLTRPYNGRAYWEQVTGLITIPDLYNGKSFSFYENLIGEEA